MMMMIIIIIITIMSMLDKIYIGGNLDSGLHPSKVQSCCADDLINDITVRPVIAFSTYTHTHTQMTGGALLMPDGGSFVAKQKEPTP